MADSSLHQFSMIKKFNLSLSSVHFTLVLKRNLLKSVLAKKNSIFNDHNCTASLNVFRKLSLIYSLMQILKIIICAPLTDIKKPELYEV
jgi:hypothetical protein